MSVGNMLLAGFAGLLLESAIPALVVVLAGYAVFAVVRGWRRRRRTRRAVEGQLHDLGGQLRGRVVEVLPAGPWAGPPPPEPVHPPVIPHQRSQR